ncbi:MAG: hypothetical protein HWD61_15680 [Parachlamydiaceae bacterium]|nr:MAG: hypothetical protein HWD61_15680 [Parachlamydiaceae bacterium]
MTISNITEKIKFLNDVQVNQDSIDLDEQGKLKRIEKRSIFANFIHWFIHLITCTRVPRNSRLDEVTQQILKEAEETYKSLDSSKRKELVNALSNLEVIVENNGVQNLQKFTPLL